MIPSHFARSGVRPLSLGGGVRRAGQISNWLSTRISHTYRVPGDARSLEEVGTRVPVGSSKWGGDLGDLSRSLLCSIELNCSPLAAGEAHYLQPKGPPCHGTFRDKSNVLRSHGTSRAKDVRRVWAPSSGRKAHLGQSNPSPECTSTPKSEVVTPLKLRTELLAFRASSTLLPKLRISFSSSAREDAGRVSSVRASSSSSSFTEGAGRASSLSACASESRDAPAFVRRPEKEQSLLVEPYTIGSVRRPASSFARSFHLLGFGGITHMGITHLASTHLLSTHQGITQLQASGGAAKLQCRDAHGMSAPQEASKTSPAFSNGDLETKLTMQQPSTNLEITPEASAMFQNVYDEIVQMVGGEQNLAPPKEIVWLNGAPGAGKGANTPFILQTRGFEARAIQVSDLLEVNPEVQAVMQSGGLVSDSMVLRLVLKRILTLGDVHGTTDDGDHLEGDSQDDVVAGAVVDGFPRTTLQVDFIKLLHDQLMDLHHHFLNTPLEPKFPRPIFRIAVLYVEEEESVRRQIARGRAAIAHNQRVKDSGFGDLADVRPTDLCEKSARRRYKIFKHHYDTLLRLKAFFPFHLIDGMGTLAECREQIEKELQYQSALELDVRTFRAISHIPLATDIAKNARKNMVARLDGYQAHEPHFFKKVIDIIATDVVPIIRRSALSGTALFNTENPIFFTSPVSAEILADVLTERGYSVTWQTRTREVPLRVDPKTHNIICTKRTSMQFRITFEKPQIRSSASTNGSSGQSASLLMPKPGTTQTTQPEAQRQKSNVCENMRNDGTPMCFVPGDNVGDVKQEEFVGETLGSAPSEKTTEGVAIPGLPGNGKIVRGDHCPPLPSWATVQSKVSDS